MKTLPMLLMLSACASAPAAQTERSSTATGWEQAAAMDARAPIPLTPRMAEHQKQNMRDHLLAVSEIVAGLGTSDWPAVQRAAARLGSSPQSTRMCEHMAGGMEAFAQQGIAFHATADGVVEAATLRDRDATLRALGDTLSACTSCHAAYRQEVLSEEGYRAATGQAPPYAR